MPCSRSWACLSVNLEERKVKVATIAKMVKDQRKPRYGIRHRNRCRLCGRPRGYYRKFDLCRLCLRQLALKGEIPGVIKSSW